MVPRQEPKQEPAAPVRPRNGPPKWKWRSRQRLEGESPSQRDGLSAVREEAKRYAYTNLVQDVGTTMKM